MHFLWFPAFGAKQMRDLNDSSRNEVHVLIVLIVFKLAPDKASIVAF
jgi:hypothetical protein